MALSAKRILIAPLDWGLGHTTRCITVINVLESLGHKVIFAGTGDQIDFIRQTFPDIDSRKIEPYRVRYSRHLLMFTILWQLPRLLGVIRREHRWLEQLLQSEQIDGIISDNRYGLWSRKYPCILITHQPTVKSGFGAGADALLRRLHYRLLNRFDEVWIPDQVDTPNLGGDLTHSRPLPIRHRYIGWLSQFKPGGTQTELTHILVLLSGPEPQRSILADKLWQQATLLHRKVVFVEGSPTARRSFIPPHITYIARADARTLQPLLERATLVICRSGYSSLMDLATLGKPAVLIPTPGQTEQEYLAASLSSSGVYWFFNQDNFDLAEAIAKAETRPRKGISASTGQELLTRELERWLSGG